MIEIKHISASYIKNKKALSDISFTLENGTLTSLVGPSGCGKTTLLKILAGFMSPDNGRVVIDDTDVTALPIQKRGTAMVFQNYALWPHMTVFQNISYGLKLQKLPRTEIDRRVNAIMEVVELEQSLATHRPTELSGGQQQRVALARALVVEPKIILMDEPLSNLDAKVRQRLRIEIREIQQRLGVTAVYVTHDQEEAMSMSDQVVVMNNGIVAQIGSPQAVYAQPADSFVAEFLGHSNLINAVAKDGVIYLDGQPIPLGRVIPDGAIKMVLRADNIRLDRDASCAGNCAALKGEILGSMYVGTYYRHLVRIGQQELFVDSCSEKKENGTTTVHVMQKDIFAFPA